MPRTNRSDIATSTRGGGAPMLIAGVFALVLFGAEQHPRVAEATPATAVETVETVETVVDLRAAALRPGLYRDIVAGSPLPGAPLEVALAAGGPHDTAGLSLPPGCAGSIFGERPDATLTYTPDTRGLQIGVRSYSDTTLIVRTPDGNWVCADDTLGRSPEIQWSAPLPGRYAIWVGVHGSVVRDATLYIDEF